MTIRYLFKSTLYSLLLLAYSDAVLAANPIMKARPLPGVNLSPRTTPIGNNLVYVLKVPVDVRNLHKDVTSVGVLCTVSPGKYLTYNPNIQNMDWVYSFDIQAGGDLAGEGYSSFTVSPSTANYRRIMAVNVIANDKKPKPNYYRCVLRLSDTLYHNPHGHNSMSWNNKDVSRLPQRASAPGVVYIPVVEGNLP